MTSFTRPASNVRIFQKYFHDFTFQKFKNSSLFQPNSLLTWIINKRPLFVNEIWNEIKFPLFSTPTSSSFIRILFPVDYTLSVKIHGGHIETPHLRKSGYCLSAEETCHLLLCERVWKLVWKVVKGLGQTTFSGYWPTLIAKISRAKCDVIPPTFPTLSSEHVLTGFRRRSDGKVSPFSGCPSEL